LSMERTTLAFLLLAALASQSLATSSRNATLPAATFLPDSKGEVFVACVNEGGDYSFSGVLDGLIVLGTALPEIGALFAIISGMKTMFDNMGSGNSDYENQWKECVEEWIEEAIDESTLKSGRALLVDLSNESNALKENLGEEEEIPTDDEIDAALRHVSTMASIMTNIHSDMAGAFKTDKIVPVWADAIAIDIAARYTVLRKIIMSGDEGLIETTAPDFLTYMEIYAGKVDSIEKDMLTDFYARKITEEKSRNCQSHTVMGGSYCTGSETCKIEDTYLNTYPYYCDKSCGSKSCGSPCPARVCDEQWAEADHKREIADREIRRRIELMRQSLSTATNIFNIFI